MINSPSGMGISGRTESGSPHTLSNLVGRAVERAWTLGPGEACAQPVRGITLSAAGGAARRIGCDMDGSAERRAGSDPPVANALQQLIRERLDRKSWSYGDVARRGGVPRSTVHHLATADRGGRLPQAATLEGLAKGLELPRDRVRRAAAEACGIHVYGTPSTAAA